MVLLFLQLPVPFGPRRPLEIRLFGAFPLLDGQMVQQLALLDQLFLIQRDFPLQLLHHTAVLLQLFSLHGQIRAQPLLLARQRFLLLGDGGGFHLQIGQAADQLFLGQLALLADQLRLTDGRLQLLLRFLNGGGLLQRILSS
ncbi:hypothetical protein D3C75_902050 [compost metagenome]